MDDNWPYTSIDRGDALDLLKEKGYTHLIFAGQIRDIPKDILDMLDASMAMEAIPVNGVPDIVPSGYKCFPIDSDETAQKLNDDVEWRFVKNNYL